ncbi:MAG: hypothetical protein HEQ21_08395 [Blastomonas sp.]|uniref:hypothetical protein n=1 Tax=Blastomonas sp. TaxID=1909299 RepID=UPI0025886269|nr:hypothetical protein [Blastomonas sp.]MCO5792825.1 hypothetical protein [Blastomonas sp.]
MKSEALTVLEWIYEPKTFFETPWMLTFADGAIRVEAGTARGQFDAVHYAAGRAFRDAADARLRTAFLAQQVQVQQSFILRPSTMMLAHPDGRTDVTMFAEPLTLQVSVGRMDLTHISGDGTVIADSRTERLDRQSVFRQSVMDLHPIDLTLQRMLQSYNSALNDGDNLLVHLHEIREALTTELGPKRSAHEVVDVSLADWRKFGKLANDEPLLEGRHRGKHQTLRKLTAAEASWAREFCKRIIEGYVSFKSAKAD